MPQTRKCWTGICLLGVTCQECSSNRLLAMYPVWFDKLLANIQVDYLALLWTKGFELNFTDKITLIF